MRGDVAEERVVVVVGADALARSAVRAQLEREGAVVIAGEGSPADAAALMELAPDVIVWDAGPAGHCVLPAVDERWNVVVLVDDEGDARRAWSEGYGGVVHRGAGGRALVSAALAVAEELRVLDGAFSDARRGRPREEALLEPLTPRELEVLALLADGLSNRRIAKRLEISEHTVKFHVNAILLKLDAASRTAAVVKAARLGLLHL